MWILWPLPPVTPVPSSQGRELHFLFLLEREPQVMVIAVVVTAGQALSCSISWEPIVHRMRRAELFPF